MDKEVLFVILDSVEYIDNDFSRILILRTSNWHW